jgi:transcription termination/antitermination protein NusA
MPSRIKYDSSLLKTMAFFESITHAKLRDCLVLPSGNIIFVVEEGDMAKAIGRGGENVRRISAALKKKVKMVEFSPDPVTFLGRFVSPVRPKSIAQDGSRLVITAESSGDRGILIGRDAFNLRNMETVLQRYFDVREIRVE